MAAENQESGPIKILPTGQVQSYLPIVISTQEAEATWQDLTIKRQNYPWP